MRKSESIKVGDVLKTNCGWIRKVNAIREKEFYTEVELVSLPVFNQEGGVIVHETMQVMNRYYRKVEA